MCLPFKEVENSYWKTYRIIDEKIDKLEFSLKDSDDDIMGEDTDSKDKLLFKMKRIFFGILFQFCFCFLVILAKLKVEHFKVVGKDCYQYLIIWSIHI